MLIHNSHHPPVTAYCITNEKYGVRVRSLSKTPFLLRLSIGID